MSNKLLDYVFPISVITPTAAASTAFLKQVCVVCKPKSGQEGNVGNIYLCTSMTEVAARTDNVEALQLFSAGMNRVYILLSNDLDLSTVFEDGSDDFYTLLVSSDFSDADIAQDLDTAAVNASKLLGDITFTAVHAGVPGNSIAVEILDTRSDAGADSHATGTTVTIHIEGGVTTADDVIAAVTESVSSSALVVATLTPTSGHDGTTPQEAVASTNLENGAAAIYVEGTGIQAGLFDGVIGVSSTDKEVCDAQAIISNRSAFFCDSTSKAKNMFFAFGKLLSNLVNWNNQQYIQMPFDNGISSLGDANDLFDNKVSFVLTDPQQYGNRLSLFAAGGIAIVAPYIIKNLMIDLQSAALSWISGNQPQYTLTEAALLETRLQEDVINSYIQVRKWIADGVIAITLIEDNFVATGNINIAQPKALWRVFNELRQTL